MVSIWWWKCVLSNLRLFCHSNAKEFPKYSLNFGKPHSVIQNKKKIFGAKLFSNDTLILHPTLPSIRLQNEGKGPSLGSATFFENSDAYNLQGAENKMQISVQSRKWCSWVIIETSIKKG